MISSQISYKKYLQSKVWKKLRLEAIQKAGGHCQLCYSSNRLEVHHRRYLRWGTETVEDLTVLCSKCHSDYSNKVKKQKPSQNKNSKEYLLQKEIGRTKRQLKLVRWSEFQRIKSYLDSLRRELKLVQNLSRGSPDC